MEQEPEDGADRNVEPSLPVGTDNIYQQLFNNQVRLLLLQPPDRNPSVYSRLAETLQWGCKCLIRTRRGLWSLAGLDVKHFQLTKGPRCWTVKSDFKQKYSTSVGGRGGREGRREGGLPHTKLITAAAAAWGGVKLQTVPSLPPSLPLIILTWGVWLWLVRPGQGGTQRKVWPDREMSAPSAPLADALSLSLSLSYASVALPHLTSPRHARLRLKSRQRALSISV